MAKSKKLEATPMNNPDLLVPSQESIDAFVHPMNRPNHVSPKEIRDFFNQVMIQKFLHTIMDNTQKIYDTVVETDTDFSVEINLKTSVTKSDIKEAILQSRGPKSTASNPAQEDKEFLERPKQ